MRFTAWGVGLGGFVRSGCSHHSGFSLNELLSKFLKGGVYRGLFRGIF